LSIDLFKLTRLVSFYHFAKRKSFSLLLGVDG
jgi:hypothetical protein